MTQLPVRRYTKNQQFTEEDLILLLDPSVTGEKLDLSGADLSDANSSLFLVDAILRLRLLDSYTHVNISSTQLPPEGLETLLHVFMEMPQLDTLHAAGCNLGKESGVCFSRLLQGPNIAMTALDVSNNRLADVGACAIASAFAADLNRTSSIHTLRTLDLSFNSLGDMAVLALCRGLTQLTKHGHSGRAPALKSLALHGNRLGDKSALCLTQLIGLRSNGEGLEELGLNDNAGITSRGMIALLQNCSPLKTLSLARCQPSLEVLQSLAIVLQADHCRLENIQLQFTEEAALQAMQAALAALSMDVMATPSASLWEIMESLALGCSKMPPSRKLLINLGYLPKAMRDACVEVEASSHVDQGSLFMNIYGALEALFSASQCITLPLEIRSWIINEIQPKHVSFPRGSVPDPLIAEGCSGGSKDMGTPSSPASSFPSLPLPSTPAPSMHLPLHGPFLSHSAIYDQQVQFEHIRKEHARAFGLLSSEIKKMADHDQNDGEGASSIRAVHLQGFRLGHGNGSADSPAYSDSWPLAMDVKPLAPFTPMATRSPSSSMPSLDANPNPNPNPSPSSSMPSMASMNDGSNPCRRSPSPQHAQADKPDKSDAPFTPSQRECIHVMIAQAIDAASLAWHNRTGADEQTHSRVGFLTERLQHLEAHLIVPPPPPYAPPPAMALQLNELGLRLTRIEESLLAINSSQRLLGKNAEKEPLDRSTLSRLTERIGQLETIVERDQSSSLALYDALLSQRSARPPNR